MCPLCGPLEFLFIVDYLLTWRDPTDTPRKFFSSCLLKDSTFAPSRIPGATVTHVHLPRKPACFLRNTDNVRHRDSCYKSLPIFRRICDSFVAVPGTLTEKLVCVLVLVFRRGRTSAARKGTSNETPLRVSWVAGQRQRHAKHREKFRGRLCRSDVFAFS